MTLQSDSNNVCGNTSSAVRGSSHTDSIRFCIRVAEPLPSIPVARVLPTAQQDVSQSIRLHPARSSGV